MEYKSFRELTIESRLTDRKIPNVVLDMALKGLSTEERQEARSEAQKDVEALTCERCRHRESCNYKDRPERLPKGVKGGSGACLQYFTERAGGFGFMTISGEPILIDEETARIIKTAIDRV